MLHDIRSVVATMATQVAAMMPQVNGFKAECRRACRWSGTVDDRRISANPGTQVYKFGSCSRQ
jgi:hypothetical protein